MHAHVNQNKKWSTLSYNKSKSYRLTLDSLIHTKFLKNLFVFLLNGLACFFCFSIPVTKYPDKNNLESNGFVSPQFKGRVHHGGNCWSGWSHHIHSQGEGYQHWCSTCFLHFIQSGPPPRERSQTQWVFLTHINPILCSQGLTVSRWVWSQVLLDPVKLTPLFPFLFLKLIIVSREQVHPERNKKNGC